MERTRKYYQELIKTEKDYKQMTKNFLQAFVGGGIVCIIGQAILDFYQNVLDFDDTQASLLMTLSMVLISAILTSIGLYDNLGQIFKCGLAIPITGFANASVASAMEYHKEGIILGIGANTLKLAGSVIVLGTVCAVLVAAIRYFIMVSL